jgi:hypothetical protein
MTDLHEELGDAMSIAAFESPSRIAAATKHID